MRSHHRRLEAAAASGSKADAQGAAVTDALTPGELFVLMIRPP